MSAPDRTNGHGSSSSEGGGPPRLRRPDRAAPEPRGRAVRPRRRPAVGHGAARADHRRAAPPGRLLPRGPRAHLPGDARPAHARRARRRADAGRAPQAGGRPRERRRPRGDRPAGRLGPGRRQRPPVRPHRPRQRDAPAPAARLLRDPVARALPRGAPARPGRHGGASDPRGRPRGQPQGLPRDPRPARVRAQQARAPLPRGQGDHRHRLRLRRPRHHHRRLPGRQPDHPRRKTVDGKVGA